MSSGQHVGGLSDQLVEDPDVTAMRAALQAKKASIKPRGKAFSGTSQQGDGDWCPVEGHGRMYVLERGQWCPHQEHDVEVMRRMKNVTPSTNLTARDTVKPLVPSQRRQSAKGTLSPKPAAAALSPEDMLIDLSAMMEDLEDA